MSAANLSQARALFESSGCLTCRGPRTAQEPVVRNARGKPGAELSAWILHPGPSRSGTVMPAFASVLSQQEALKLGEWISRGMP